eukprot:Gb_19054 [translate_table: standard]
MAAASLSEKWLQRTLCLVLLFLHLNGGNGETSLSEMEWEEEIRRQWSILGVEDGLTEKSTRIKFAAWRLSVEANNARDWKEVPSQYKSYVEDYMIKGQYTSDSRAAIEEALKYVNTLTLGGDGMDAWILDVDDTALSTMPYWREHRWGAEPHNPAALLAWEMEGRAPAIPTTLEFFEKLIAKRIKVFFISSRRQGEREVTYFNLERAGYRGFADLMLRDEVDLGLTMADYTAKKREELVRNGYRILGIVADQWSEMSGNFVGQRTFKLPNAMYYTP